MKYTYRYAHMEHAPAWHVGDEIKTGDVIGIMGRTGQVSGKNGGAHLHADCVVGEVREPFHLCDIGRRYAPSKRQLDYIIDSTLFGCRPIITTPYDDLAYAKKFKKRHPALDIIPAIADKKEIYFNRVKIKRAWVTFIAYQPESYGNVIYIAIEV